MEVFHQSVLVSQLDLLGQHRLEPVPAEASVLFAVSAELLFCCVPDPLAHPCQPGFSALIFYAANHLFVGKGVETAEDLSDYADQRAILVSDGYAEEGFLDTPQGSLQVFYPLFVAYSGPRYDFSERLQRLLMCAVRLAVFPLIGSCHEEELHEDVREDNGSPAGADELLSMFSYPRVSVC